MGKNLTLEDREKIAYARYLIILPLMKTDFDEKSELIKEAAGRNYHLGLERYGKVSKRTLWRWIEKFTNERLSGLMPKERLDKGRIRLIEDKTLNKALELKKELPARSTRKVIRMMELGETVNEGEIKRSTLNRIFQEKEYTKEDLVDIKAKKVRRRFEREEVNSLWQGDVSDAIYLADPQNPGKMRKCYLISWIDDKSRDIMWGEFFWGEDLPCLEITFKKGIKRRGIPDQVYVDRGKIYCSDQFNLICAELAVEILYAPDARSKAKIERWHRTIQEDFYTEVTHAGVKTLEELNRLFWLWLEQEYELKVHSETGKKPLDGWNEIKNVRRVDDIV